MNTLVIIAITLLVAYTIILCVVNKQIPDSLSQSVFFLPQSASWIWTLVIGFVAVAVMPVMLEKADDDWKYMAFLSCFGLILVALCPLSPKKNSIQYQTHMIGAWMCAVSSQILMAVCNSWLMLMWVPWVIAFIWITNHSKWRTKVFWAEWTCFPITFTFCLI